MEQSQTVALSLSFLTEYSLVVCSARVLVMNGSMWWYLQLNQVAHVVQLLQDGIYILAIARSAVSPSTLS